MHKIILFLYIVLLATHGFAERLALVIGNSIYPESRLNNTINDAKDIADKLSKLGFTTTLKTDLDKESFEGEIDNLTGKINYGDEVVFYYAGHGVQIEGENYLVPVKAKIDTEVQCKHRAVNCNYILESLQKAHVSILILDACRNNPFAWKRSASRGLAAMEGRAGSQYIIYSTAAGLEAEDGNGINSPFATALKKYIGTPNITVEDMMRDVIKEVELLTLSKQTPAAYGNLKERFYFAGAVEKEQPPSTPIVMNQTVVPIVQKKNIPIPRPPMELNASVSGAAIVVKSNVNGDIYINDLFKDKIKAGSEVTISGLASGDCTITLKGVLKSETRTEHLDAEEIKHISFELDNSLPGFVYVSGGSFQMGATSGSSDEKPIHLVNINSLYVGQYELTQKEWMEVMNYNPSSQKGDLLPVDNISWYEAILYCNKRSIKENLTPAYSINGSTNPERWGSVPDNSNSNWEYVRFDCYANGYRLPTEAEWEYIARGGLLSQGFKFSGSNDLDVVAWHGSNSEKKLHEVGTKLPNELNIYDMSGNVLEWCWDWYDENYYSQSFSNDPKGALSGFSRILRGGYCTALMSSNFKSTYRHYYKPEGKKKAYGIRLVRFIQ